MRVKKLQSENACGIPRELVKYNLFVTYCSVPFLGRKNW